VTKEFKMFYDFFPKLAGAYNSLISTSNLVITLFIITKFTMNSEKTRTPLMLASWNEVLYRRSPRDW